MAIDPAILNGLYAGLVLVWGPVISLLGFGTLRHEVRKRGAWRPATVRALTVLMWSAAIGYGVLALLGQYRAVIVINFAALIAFLLSERIARIIAGPPTARHAAATAAWQVFDEFHSKYEPEDAEALRTHLADLDKVVTTDTFEFVQLTRAYILHALDGGSPDDPNAVRWRERLDEIAKAWWRRRPTDDPAARLSRWARRRSRALAFLGGFALGAGIWSGVGVAPVVASVVVAWLLLFVSWSRVITATLGGAAVGLLAALGLEIAACTACDWTTTATTVALLVVALVLTAWFADTREPAAVGSRDDDRYPSGPRAS